MSGQNTLNIVARMFGRKRGISVLATGENVDDDSINTLIHDRIIKRDYRHEKP